MSNVKKGGTAFPTPYARVSPGMSLRDYFAAKALTGLMVRSWEDENGNVPKDVFTTWATSAYKIADEMLKAREP